MASERRIGSEDSETRERLLDAAQELLGSHGHSGVSVRKLAAQAGLKRQLVHYYFRSMEELFLEILDRAYARHFERNANVMGAPNPLRALWQTAFFPEGIFLEIHTIALANEFESIRQSIAAFLKRSREVQIGTLRGILGTREGKDGIPSAEGLAVLMRGVAREIALERKLGVEIGHEQALADVERFLKLFD